MPEYTCTLTSAKSYTRVKLQSDIKKRKTPVYTTTPAYAKKNVGGAHYSDVFITLTPEKARSPAFAIADARVRTYSGARRVAFDPQPPKGVLFDVS